MRQIISIDPFAAAPAKSKEPANMLQVGIAGIGFMGMIHYLAYQRTKGAKVAAICTRDAKKLAGDWREIQGNFGPRGEVMDLSGIGKYESYSDLLANDEIDLIDICLPPNLHVDFAVQALEAGKHVFVEKPMALTAEGCREMVEAAAKAGKQVLVGHVLPFFPEYAKAREFIASGQYGKVLGGHFRRVISDPLWLKDFYDPAKVGGPLVDLHVHDAHFIRMVFGMPKSVASQGRMRGEVVEYCNSLFAFDDPQLVVSATSGVIHQQGRPFTHGFEIHLERATLLYDFAVIDGKPELTMPLTVLTGDEKENVIRPEVGGGDEITAFQAEIEEAAKSIESGRPSPILGGELARDAIILCHKQSESVQAGKPVSVR
jgi:predicted dehydrogenase